MVGKRSKTRTISLGYYPCIERVASYHSFNNRTIKEVAIRHNGGVYFICGKKRHAHLIHDLTIMFEAKDNPFTTWTDVEFQDLTEGGRGFLLDDYRFVDGMKASEIAFAAKQIVPENTNSPPFALKDHDLIIFSLTHEQTQT